jgi:predicted Rossmann fold nucleotide-binding protein DprA/Smf involved in DNA uptake
VSATDSRRLAGVIDAPSIDDLAAVTGLRPDQVELALVDLERRGIIERRDGHLGLYWPSSLP